MSRKYQFPMKSLIYAYLKKIQIEFLNSVKNLLRQASIYVKVSITKIIKAMLLSLSYLQNHVNTYGIKYKL